MSKQKSIDLAQLRNHYQISAAAFQHPDDRKATEALRSVPVFPQVVKLFAGGLAERLMSLEHLTHCIRVGPSQGVDLFKHYVRAAEILSVPELPDLFISPSSAVNAFAAGMSRPAIVLTRGLIESMSLPETMAVLAHELGHVKCDHMINQTIASLLAQFGIAALAQLVPVAGSAALLAIQAPLYSWSRMAELSCDRASLLAVQDSKIVAGALAKLGGWSEYLGEVDFQSLRDQGDEYDRMDNDAVMSVLKIFSMLQNGIYLTHPLPIQRVKRILQWGDSDQYREIVAGIYPRQEHVSLPNRCKNCLELLAPGDMHCVRCGLPAPLTLGSPACPNCGTAIPTRRPRHCGNCGISLDITEFPV